MNVFAIADLHLGFSTGKWMDGFGDHWIDHASKVEHAWRRSVRDEDVVLLPGDLTWAMKPQEARRDLEWLAALPGQKVLSKGNHDYWWPKTRRKLDALLPEGVFAVRKRPLTLRGVPIVAVRGGDFEPRDGEPLEPVQARLEREERELERCLEQLAADPPGRVAPVAMFHYPPFPPGERESRFTHLLEEAGIGFCVFGHLHSEAEWMAVFQGAHRGIEYRLVACDALGFEPSLLFSAASAPPHGAGD